MFKKKKPECKTLDELFLIEGNKKIYKYLSLDKFLYLLEKKSLFLMQAAKYWEDPYEGITVDSKIQGYINYVKNVDKVKLNNEVLGKDIDIINGLPQNIQDWAERSIVFQRHQKKLVHGTSWTLNPESDAMWRIYSPYKHGIQIQTTVDKLKLTLKEVNSPKSWIETYYTVGKVSYDLPTKTHINLEEDFLFKGRAFEHEQEVRGLVQPIHPHVSYSRIPEAVDFINAKIVGNFVEKVIVDPRAEDWFVDAVTSYCKKKDILYCEKSRLYTKPSFTF